MSARNVRTTAAGLLLAAAAATTIAGAGLAGATTDPYNSDGMWLVPTEITPGTYRVALTDSSMGYSQTCADYSCEIGTDGFIENELYHGPGVLVIPANTVMVQLRGLTLTRMG